MARLRDRHRQIPGGLRYRQPETGFDSTKALAPMPSLRALATAVINHRKGNPHLLRLHGWKTVLEEVELEMEAYNAKICLDQGWSDFVIASHGEPHHPKSSPLLRPLSEAVAAVKVGAKTLLKWLGDGGQPVARIEAERRARICAVCPRNDRGDWTRFFTIPAAELIRKQMEAAKAQKMETSRDAELHICDACGCPLVLKVHVPLVHILQHTTGTEKAKFDPKCWIIEKHP